MQPGDVPTLMRTSPFCKRWWDEPPLMARIQAYLWLAEMAETVRLLFGRDPERR